MRCIHYSVAFLLVQRRDVVLGIYSLNSTVTERCNAFISMDLTLIVNINHWYGLELLVQGAKTPPK